MACGKSDDKKASKATTDQTKKTPAESKTATDKTKPPGKRVSKEPKPPTSGPEVDQCKRILEKTWVAAKAVLMKLGTKDVDRLKKLHGQGGKRFVELCSLLPADKRDCVDSATNAANGLYSCKVNAGRKQKVWAVDLSRQVQLFTPKPLDAATAKGELAAVVGTWTNTWKSMGQVTELTIGKDGAGTTKVTKRGKAETPQKSLVLFKQTGRIALRRGTTTQSHNYFRANKNTFYLSNNLIYSAYPIPNRTEFIIRAGWDFVIYKAGKCEVVSGRGAVAKAVCKFGVDKGKPVFRVEYQYPGRMNFKNKPVVTKRKYLVVGKHLLHESLVSIGKYTRTK